MAQWREGGYATFNQAKYLAADGKISLGGSYVVVDTLKNPHTDKDDVIYVGERNYDDPLLKPMEGINEPWIENTEITRKASKYVRRVLHSINKKLLEEGGVKLRYRDLKIKAMRKQQFSINEDGQVGMVLGYYDTETKELYLNPLLYNNERLLEKVTAHEIVHYAQHKLGIIGTMLDIYGPNSRPMIENHAENAVERLDTYYLDAIQPVKPFRQMQPTFN